MRLKLGFDDCDMVVTSRNPLAVLDEILAHPRCTVDVWVSRSPYWLYVALIASTLSPEQIDAAVGEAWAIAAAVRAGGAATAPPPDPHRRKKFGELQPRHLTDYR